MGKMGHKRTKVRSEEAGAKASMLLREKHKAGLAAREELAVEDPYEVEEIKALEAGGPPSLKDKLAHESDVLKSEWALFGGELGPQVWLETVKGYTEKQARRFIDFEGESAWLDKRQSVQNAILEKMAKRNIDQIVENNEYFTKGAQLGLAKVMDSLAKNPIKKINPTTGKWESGLSMKDMAEAASALDKFHAVYLKAMGIHPKENVGISQVINQIKMIQVSSGGHTTTATASMTETTAADGTKVITEGVAPDPRLERLSYDEMFMVIEKIREAGFVKDDEEEHD